MMMMKSFPTIAPGPTITIQDVIIVVTLLRETVSKGRGAFRRTAKSTELPLTTVHDSIAKIERWLECPLFEIEPRLAGEPQKYRDGKITRAGEQFLESGARVVAAWHKELMVIEVAAHQTRRAFEKRRREREQEREEQEFWQADWEREQELRRESESRGQAPSNTD
jgi:hypothetical protein